MPGAPTSVDCRASFSRMSERSTGPAVKPVASKRRPRRDSASTALTGGVFIADEEFHALSVVDDSAVVARKDVLVNHFLHSGGDCIDISTCFGGDPFEGGVAVEHSIQNLAIEFALLLIVVI